MPNADKIFALRGMRDVTGGELMARRRIQSALEERLRLHAYAPVDLPILENTELYLRKSGEDIAARLYAFDYQSRRIALRPELTASILRAYVECQADAPLPLRLQYAGPVFRYEKPGQNRFRQFTLAGAETLGLSGALADAELLYLACSGLERLGITRYELVVGHTGALSRLLRSLGLREQLVNLLLRNMENLRKRGMEAVIDALRELYPDLAAAWQSADSAADREKSEGLVAVLRGMNDSEAHQAVADFLRSLNIRIDSNRDEDEIIDRLLGKIRERDQAPKLRRALDYMARLSQLTGPPAQVLPDARQLLAEFSVDAKALDELEATLDSLPQFGGVKGDIILDFGLNRGLHYYTGLIFEIHAITESGERVQLCGGGRYDKLVSALGGEAAPAAGFAWGIERIASLLPADPGDASQSAAAFIIPLDAADMETSLKLARDMRGQGIAVEICHDDRSLRRRLKHAARKGAPLVIIIGERERQMNEVMLRDMRRHEEERVPLAELVEAAQKRLAAPA